MALIRPTFSNIVDSGTEGTKIATGTTAQRGSTAGQLRFNSTTGFAEYYDGTTFKAIDAPPAVSSIDITEIDPLSGSTTDITISGNGFSSGATVRAIGSNGSSITATTVVRTNSTELIATFTDSEFNNLYEPYDIQVTNSSGLSNTLFDQINVDSAPTWSTSAGSIGTVYDASASTTSFSVSASDAEGETVSYSLLSGSLPAGASLNSSTGAITGFSTVSSDTTSSFTLRATSGGKTSDRAFSITVRSPITQAFLSSGTWSVPTGVTRANILVVAGGGSGGTTSNGGQSYRGSGGGAGGLIYIPNWDLTGSSSYTITVGLGGAVGVGTAQNGQNSTVVGTTKTLTALGGGHGGFSDNTNNHQAGGSSGGGWYPGYASKPHTQPANTSDGVNTYNTTGWGNDAGTSGGSPSYGAGGGGAGGIGGSYNTSQLGGIGRDYSSVFGTGYGDSGWFASGGSFGGYQTDFTSKAQGGGGAGYNSNTNVPSNANANGLSNTGGGGGSGGHGGSGVVLIKY